MKCDVRLHECLQVPSRKSKLPQSGFILHAGQPGVGPLDRLSHRLVVVSNESQNLVA
jgi:hypothetical protein